MASNYESIVCGIEVGFGDYDRRTAPAIPGKAQLKVFDSL